MVNQTLVEKLGEPSPDGLKDLFQPGGYGRSSARILSTGNKSRFIVHLICWSWLGKIAAGDLDVEPLAAHRSSDAGAKKRD